MGTTYRAVKGTKLTITEGDDSREWASEAGTKAKGSSLTFDRSGGWFHATQADPETAVLTIDEATGISKAGVIGARPGTWVMFYFSGSINPTFTGNSGTITSYNTITTAGVYECWLVNKGNGNYSLSIPQASSGGTGDITPPTVSSMIVENASQNDLVVTLSNSSTFTNVGYTFRVNTVARTLTSVSGSPGTVATFLISGAAILSTDTLDLAYDSTTGDTIKTSNSIELVTFTATTVTNNVAGGAVPLPSGSLMALPSDSATPTDLSASGRTTAAVATFTAPANAGGINTYDGTDMLELSSILTILDTAEYTLVINFAASTFAPVNQNSLLAGAGFKFAIDSGGNIDIVIGTTTSSNVFVASAVMALNEQTTVIIKCDASNIATVQIDSPTQGLSAVTNLNGGLANTGNTAFDEVGGRSAFADQILQGTMTRWAIYPIVATGITTPTLTEIQDWVEDY